MDLIYTEKNEIRNSSLYERKKSANMVYTLILYPFSYDILYR